MDEIGGNRPQPNRAFLQQLMQIFGARGDNSEMMDEAGEQEGEDMDDDIVWEDAEDEQMADETEEAEVVDSVIQQEIEADENAQIEEPN